MNIPDKKRFDYKWVIMGLCFLMVCTVLGFCSSSKSLYVAAITEHLGISRSAFSINDSCRFITTAVVNIFFGTLITRFGAKKLIGAGFVCLIASCLIYSFAANVFMFYIGGIFLGLGLSWTTTTMVGSVINKWFTENRGTIMGAVLAANGIGAAISVQIVSPIIYQEGITDGYKDAYRLVALILLVVGAIVMVFFKNNPKGAEDTGFVKHKKKARGQTWSGIEYSQAMKRTYFYAAAVCIFITGMLLQGISGIAAPLLRDVGLDESYVALVLSAHSLALTVFKFGVGIIYDKFGLRKTSNLCAITAIIVMFMLANVTNSPMGKLLAMIYGIFSSLALPLETIMLPIYSNDLFGEKSYNKILGLFVSVNTAGYALGAPIANLCYDKTGSYNIAIYISCGLMIIATLVMQYVITAAHKERKLVEETEKEAETINA